MYKIKDGVSFGYTTFVGFITNEFPLEDGNCFGLHTSDEKHYHILNMCSENLEHLIETDKVSFPVKIMIVDDTPNVINDGQAIIVDSRIPLDFFINQYL